MEDNQVYELKKRIRILEWDKRLDISFNCTVDIADPDWKGNIGLITSLIPGVNLDADNTFAIVCGPPVMYKFVIEEFNWYPNHSSSNSTNWDISYEVSLVNDTARFVFVPLA